MKLEELQKIGIKDTKNIRCLTMSRPWASAITQGNKRIINTPWRPSYSLIGNFVFLHSAKQYDKKSTEFMRKNGFIPPKEENCPPGIIGMAEITQCVEKDESPWFFEDYYGWKIGTVIAFDKAIRCAGRRQLWLPSSKTFMKTIDMIKTNQFRLRLGVI